jgi:hypothetical protein
MSESPNIVVDAISNTDRSIDPLVRIEQLQRGREYLDLKIEEAVIEARTNSRWKGSHVDHVPGRMIEQRENDEFGIASWQDIADRLGVSRQSAHRKYAGIVDQ